MRNAECGIQKTLAGALAAAALLAGFNGWADGFADTVVGYDSGTNFAAGFTNAAASLGPPTTNATPFSPAFRNTQLVSLGTNGSLTVRFDTPIENDPTHRYGFDFTIYGNSGFLITNGNFSGGGITDGSIFGNNPGATRVSVSRDNVTYYVLNPALAPTVDGWYPTDGSGDPSLPVNPALTQGDFAGQGLTGIRALYNGSAGGGSFDLSWARDTNGNSVFLSDVSYARVEVLSGKSEVDAFSVVAPAAAGGAAIFTENFAKDPKANGWQTFGDTNLFHWNATNHYLDVTWDSSQPNSYFYHPLGTILTKEDDFSLAFNLSLSDAITGADTNAPYTFELAVSLIKLADATGPNFLRGTGINSPNLVEFDYFPDDGLGDTATVAPTMISSSNQFNDGGFTFPLALTTNDVFQVQMTYTASNQTLVTAMTRNGQPFGPVKNATLGAAFGDFQVDQVAVSSYSGAGQDPNYAGSILAHGKISNLVVATPPPPVMNVSGGFGGSGWRVQFTSRTNWLYTLERTVDFQAWSAASAASNGNGNSLILQDTNAPGGKAFYRVRAQKP
jgi:hypothetical protein